MILSRRVKEAFKTALAMTIAIGIALHMDWDKPMWAGFAVAFISLATIGQSLNKGIMRLFGTFLAVFAALFIIALFAQDRWLFMLSLSIWVGFCTYMMGGEKNQYVWHVGSFACVIIAMDAGVDPVNAFDMAMLRTQETGLGILVYTLVSVFLWPSSSYADFEDAGRQLTSIQQQVYRAYTALMNNPIDCKKQTKESHDLRLQEIQQQTRFVQLLAAVETEEYKVWEVRHQWANYRGQVVKLSETMQRWGESFTEIQELDLQELLPDLKEFCSEVEDRLTQLNRMLAGKAPSQSPQTITLRPSPDAFKQLSSFHKVVFAVFLKHLNALEPLTRSMFNTLSNIKGTSTENVPVAVNHSATFIFLPDLDRLLAVVRVMAAMWLSYLVLIYINDIPGGAGVVSFVVPLCMALALSPQLPLLKVFKPAMFSVLFVSPLYIFIMPQLSTYLELGLLIFIVTYLICYLFAAPQQMLGKLFGLAIFLAIASISNVQSYSFLVIADTALMFVVVFTILAISAYIPFSPQPERAFLRLLSRFFRCSEYLLSTMNSDPKRRLTGLGAWKKAFYCRELNMLPGKLATWGRFIDSKTLSGTTPEQIQALTTNLQALAYSLQELSEARGSDQAKFLVQELLVDIKSWRSRMQQAFLSLSEDPTAGNSNVFRTKLHEIMEHMETRITETLTDTTENQLSAQEAENFYHLLGALRGLSVALVDFAESADAINWSHWKEEKFLV